MTAAATTGPNNDPRPTSSTPATCAAPAAHARFSNLRVQRSFFSKRNLAVAAEIFSALEVFDVRVDLDTDADQHLRRRSGAKQEQMFDECVGTGQSPVPTQMPDERSAAYCCSTSFSRAALPLSPRR